MKKALVSILIIAVLCGSLVVFASCGFDLESEDMLKYVNKSLDPIQVVDGFTLNVLADVYTIAVYPTSADKITIQYVEHKDVTVTADQTGSVVNIRQKTNTIFKSGKRLYLVIGIPRAFNNYFLDINMSAGSLSIEDLSLNTLEVKMDAGSANIELEKALQVEIDNNAGAVHLDGNADVVEIDNDAGSVEVDLDAKAVDVSTDTGSIKFDLDCPLIKLETDAGSIRGTVEGVKNQYKIDVSVDAGKCNLKNQQGDGVHFLEIDVDAGSVNVSFDN